MTDAARPQAKTGLPDLDVRGTDDVECLERVEQDNVSPNKGEIVRGKWFAEIQPKLKGGDLGQKILNFVRKHHPGVPIGLGEELLSGSFNCSFKISFENGSAALLRVPIPGMCAFADEKTMAEAATMLYVAERTTIPVPKVYHYGPASKNPTGLGTAFIIMEYLPHYTNVSDALHHPAGLFGWIPDKQEYFYSQMADIMLQLSELESPGIGRLGMENGEFVLYGSPITLAMNDMVVTSGTPEEAFPPLYRTYSTACDWFAASADMQLAKMIFGDNEDDGQGKAKETLRSEFIARYLFRDLMTRRKTGTPETFRLWCDDLRPNSILVDEDGKLVGVVDWEFSYFAPVSYTSECPYWLMTDGFPDDAEDVQNFVDDLPQRTDAFLEAFKMEEEALERAKGLQRMENHGNEMEDLLEKTKTLDLQKHDIIPTPIHDQMKEKLEKYNGAEPIDMAVRLPWMFDGCFWENIDEESFGKNKTSGYRGRLDILPAHIKDLMEEVVTYREQKRSSDEPKGLMRALLAKLEDPSSQHKL